MGCSPQPRSSGPYRAVQVDGFFSLPNGSKLGSGPLIHEAFRACLALGLNGTRDEMSVAVEARHRVGVIVSVAEHLGEDPTALHVEAYVEVVGHADTTMHLHTFLNRKRCR